MSEVKYPGLQACDTSSISKSGYGGAFSIPEFCKRYGIGRSTAYAEHNAGRLNFRKVGNRSLILHGEAERWAASLPETIK